MTCITEKLSRASQSIRRVVSEVLSMVVMKSSVSWEIMPCSPLKVNRLLEECVVSISKVEE
jgi:hypothetical protein